MLKKIPLCAQFLVRGLKQGLTHIKQSLEIKRNISLDDRKDGNIAIILVCV